VIQRALLQLLLADVERDALRVLASLVVALALVVACAVAGVTALVAAAAGARPPAAGAVPTPTPGATAVPADAAAGVVAVARRYVGTPYVWGGADPRTGFDCSGLVQWAYGQAGVRLPRTAQQQHDATDRVASADLRPGDLVFFRDTYKRDPTEPITHVGIYVGGGRMLNAPVEGDVVREMDVFTGFWGAHYAGAGRPAAAGSRR
jgi:cell wall-associated NlpC family hydrolase